MKIIFKVYSRNKCSLESVLRGTYPTRPIEMRSKSTAT